MGRRKKSHDVKELTWIYLRADEIEVDETRNTRSYDHANGSGRQTKGIAEPGRGMTDEQLADDIRQNGLIQPVGVVRLADGRFRLRFGYRRMRALRSIDPRYPTPCILRELSGDEDEDHWQELSENLRENLNRKALRPFELAEALFQMKKLRPGVTQKQIASDVQISTTYCNQLLIVRSKACPQLWNLFVEYGLHFTQQISLVHMAKIVKLPKSRQIAAWKKLTEQKKHRSRSPNGTVKNVTAKTVRAWIATIEALDASPDFKEGARYALECVVRKESFGARLPGEEKQSAPPPKSPARPAKRRSTGRVRTTTTPEGFDEASRRAHWNEVYKRVGGAERRKLVDQMIDSERRRVA